MPKLTYKHYLNITLILAALNSPLAVIGTFYDVRDFTTYFILISWWVLDILFITLAYHHLRPNKYEGLLFLLVLLSVIIGLGNGNEFSRNYITDVTNPVFFLCKIAILRKYLLTDLNFMVYFKDVLVRRIVKYALVSSVLTLILFYWLAQYKQMYVGLTPMTQPILIGGLIKGSIIFQVGAILIVLLSGKRALILSSIALLLIFKFIIIKRFKTLLYFLLFLVFMGSIIKLTNVNVFSISAFQKYEWSINKINESIDDDNYDNKLIDIISGGRLNEITSVMNQMNPLDYVIGKGTGFTYPLIVDYYPYFTNTNNLHLTPLSLISKYGLLFYLVLMTYFMIIIVKVKRANVWSVFFGLYLIGSLIDMLFAYTLFVDPILPMAVGYLSANRVIIKYKLK